MIPSAGRVSRRAHHGEYYDGSCFLREATKLSRLSLSSPFLVWLKQFCRILYLVAEWIHFTLFGIVLPTIKLKVYTFGGL